MPKKQEQGAPVSNNHNGNINSQRTWERVWVQWPNFSCWRHRFGEVAELCVLAGCRMGVTGSNSGTRGRVRRSARGIGRNSVRGGQSGFRAKTRRPAAFVKGQIRFWGHGR